MENSDTAGRGPVTVTAPAKINLLLRIERRRDDGFHDLATLFHAVDLCDQLEITEADDDDPGGGEAVALSIDGPDWTHALPVGADNLVLRADALLRELHDDLPRVAYRLTKAIPAQAGLGGGSADAAATLVGLNALFDLGYSREGLAELAGQLGSDTSFCVLGGCAIGRGRGEQLEQVDTSLDAHVLLVRPDLGISTAEAYAACTPRGADESALAAMCAAVESGDLAAVRDRLANDFETDALPGADTVREVKRRLTSAGATSPLLSGSGSAVFALFGTKDEAAAARAALVADGGAPVWTALARLVAHGPEIDVQPARSN